MDARTREQRPKHSARVAGRTSSHSEEGVAVLGPEASCIFRLTSGDAHIVDLNAGFAQRFEIATDEVRGRSLREILPAAGALTIIRALRRAVIGRRPREIVIPLFSATKGARHIPVQLKRVGDDSVLATLPTAAAFGRRRSDRELLETLGAVDDGVIYVVDARTTALVYVTDRS